MSRWRRANHRVVEVEENMFKVSKTALSLVGALLLAGCGLGAERAINELKATPATGDTFNQTLAREYLALAEKEWRLVDYDSAEYFATKGVSAARGESPGLTPLAARTLRSDFVEDAASLHAQTADYINRMRGSDPVNAARAQALMDCVLEEYEEYWQVDFMPYWLASCRDPLVALLEEGMPATIVLSSDVLFDFDRSDIKPQFEGVLREVAELIRATGDPVQIEGHTDSIGPAEYNMRLGQRRADSVANFLAAQTVPRELMTTVSFGETRPVAPNTTPDGRDNPEGRALNRRVEIKR
ncbi:MAG: OmpA family protein [Geminicoccaceae bacterium]|nr:MAG: OmpA family protein [Geminicoccaceae bacterium]